MSFLTRAHGKIHNRLVFSRRVAKLVDALDGLLPDEGTILDIGCGNGVIAAELQKRKPGRKITGIDVVGRESCLIPCQIYDGETIPFAPGSVDAVMFVDVLHHTPDPWRILAQAAAAARSCLVIKDHYSENVWAHQRLRFMDWVGNAPYGISLPNNYQSRRQWRGAFAALGLRETACVTALGLYPAPFHLIFENGLHFVNKLEK